MTATKAYAIKGPDGSVRRLRMEPAFASFEPGETCVPVTIYEGEPKAVAPTCFHTIKKGAEDDREWPIPAGKYALYPDTLRLFTHPPGTLALLRDILKDLQAIERNSINNGMLWQREHIKRIEAALKEAG